MTIERRVLFRMDLPNKKCIGVKAKPNRLIRDVFRPILQKYGYKMEDIDVHLVSSHFLVECFFLQCISGNVLVFIVNCLSFQ